MEVYLGFKDEDGNPTHPLGHQMDYQSHIGYARHVLLADSLGTGKTEAMCLEAIMQSMHYNNNLGLMGRKVLDAYKKSTLIQLLDIAGNLVVRHSIQDHVIEFANGSKIIYMALDDTRDAIQRIKSMNLGWFAFDQLEEVPQATYQSALGQLRRKNASRVNFHTCNPAGHDWVWKKWKKKKNKDIKGGYYLVESKTWRENVPPPESQNDVRLYSDNPHLPYEYIRTLLENPQQWVNRYVYCKWDDFAGLVYPMFDEKMHLIPSFNIPDWWNHYIIYDYGYKNPSAILFAATDNEGKIFIYDLIYQTETRIESLAEMVNDRINSNIYYTFLADPSIMRTERDGNTIAGEWEEYGIFWLMAKNDKRAGIDRMSGKLEPDRNDHVDMVFFDKPAMQPLIDEIMEYKWKELRYGIESREKPEEPMKVNDHALDCCRYLVHHVMDAELPESKSDTWGKAFFNARKKNSKNSWMSI